MKCGIVGGTGTLGQELARRLITQGHRVSVFSRCELKQAEMAKEFTDVDFFLGDIREPSRILQFFSLGEFDVVYHVAALKHVDVLEKNPEESVKTNILGTINVADAAETAGVPFVVFSSTDKAVDPINVYGMSKALPSRS
jgi:UDP-N-acetylglucosamine 4,6-dehydratase